MSDLPTSDPAAPTSPYESAAVDRVRAILDAPPAHIGRYRILERIGHGGMGEVFVAEQTEPLKRRVALKIIKAGMDTRQVVARFEAERQALAMMDHPNIARVFDAGTTDTGRPYFVMELVRGVPITQFCDDARLTPRQRIELLVPVCQAVQHAHQKGIIHRDLKPSNVLVTLHDGRPVPKVIDFGIAKATGPSLTDKTVYTEFRQMIGTPAYMSPEQAEMSGLDIDTRSDIYSLGVLMYELLTGTTPFDTARLVKAGLAEIGRIIKEEDPPRPSLRISSLGQTLPGIAAQRGLEPAKLGRHLAGEPDWIVMKAMEKDRRRRYETASDFAADIQRHLAGEPIEAAPPSAAYRARKFVRKYRRAVVAVGISILILGLGLAGTTTQMIRATRAEEVAARQRDDISRQSQQLSNVAEKVIGKYWNESGDGGNLKIGRGHGISFTPSWIPHQDTFSWDSRASILLQPDKSVKFQIGHALEPRRAEVFAEMLELYGVSAVTERNERIAAAETEAYVANLALAQAAMNGGRWPEARERLNACPESRRGWEWRLLSACIAGQRNIQAITIEPNVDNDLLLAAFGEKAAARGRSAAGSRPELWDGKAILASDASDADTSASNRNFINFGPALGAAISSDGNRVVTWAADRVIRLFDPKNGRLLISVPLESGVSTATFTPDGSRLLVGLDDLSLQVWDTRDHAVDFQTEVQSETNVRIAGAYVQSLTGSKSASESMLQQVRQELTLTPLQRYAALQQIKQKLKPRRSSNEVWDILINPDMPEGLYGRTLLQIHNGLASGLEGNNLHSALGYAQYRVGQYQAAIETLNRPETLNPLNDTSLPASYRYHLCDTVFLAMANWKLKRVSEARALLQEFLNGYWSADERYRGRYLALAREAALMIDPSQAPESAGPIDGKQSAVRYLIPYKTWPLVADAGQSAEQYKLALSRAELALSLVPTDVDGLAAMGAAQYRTGDYRTALSTLSRAIKARQSAGQPADPRASAVLAMAEFRLGRIDAARAALIDARPTADADPMATALFNEAVALIDPSAAPPATRPGE